MTAPPAMHSRRRRSKHPALTLLEMMAVLTLLSLVSVTVVGVAGPLSFGQRRAAAVGAVREAIDRARLLAISCGAVELQFGEQLVAIVIGKEGGVECVTTLPAGWKAALVEDSGREAPDRRFVFRSDGTCPDATIAVHGPRGALQRLELLGVSGQIRALDVVEMAR